MFLKIQNVFDLKSRIFVMGMIEDITVLELSLCQKDGEKWNEWYIPYSTTIQ